jgi:L-rhamnose-H+ transport protein
MIASNPLLGTALHALGALSSSACYTPQKRVKGWSWQSYWMVQAAFCWFLLPILGAWLTVPNLWRVLQEGNHAAMTLSLVLGMAYGIGGTAFNISIRYIGFSLTYALAVGLSSIMGTLVPQIVKGTIPAMLAKPGSGWVLIGIVIGSSGVGLCGLAGRIKELRLHAANPVSEFSMGKGLTLSILAGVLSAVYGFALEVGEPVAELAEKYGAGVFRGNVVFIFANLGAFISTAIYCLYLHAKHRTLGELVELPAGSEEAKLPVNFLMAGLTGMLWYGQFFLYNLAHVRMGTYQFTSWALHMIMLVLFSNAIAIMLREWAGVGRKAQVVIFMALLVLSGAVMAIAYGNYIGTRADISLAAAAQNRH